MIPDKNAEEAILPCPWCGGAPPCEVVHYKHGGGRSGVGATNQRAVWCQCGARGPDKFDRAQAISAWNRVAAALAGLDAAREEAERLRALVSTRENVPQIVIDDALAVCRACIGVGVYNSHTAPEAAARVLEWNDACPSAALSAKEEQR